MRIAFIVPQFPTLSETFILNQITGLIDRGHQVDIHAERPRGRQSVHPEVKKYGLLECTYYRSRVPANRLSRALKAAGLFVRNFRHNPAAMAASLEILRPRLWRPPFARLQLMYAMIPFLRSAGYDITHCHFAHMGVIGVFLRRHKLIRCPIVTTFHGMDVNVIPRKFGSDCYEVLFRQGDLFTANTNFTAAKARSLGCPPEKTVILPMGVNLSKYKMERRPLSPDGPFRILTVARLVEIKGIRYAILAVGKLARQGANFAYDIVGDGPLHGSLQALIASLDLSDRVRLCGWKTQDEICEMYAQAHVFVLPSVTTRDGDQEGQGLVLQEAQATGLPVVSTLHNGFPEGVLDGETGFLVPERDVDALAERLLYLMEHPEARERMGRAGRAFVERKYDIDRLNDRLVEIYQELVERSHRNDKNIRRVATASAGTGRGDRAGGGQERLPLGRKNT